MRKFLERCSANYIAKKQIGKQLQERQIPVIEANLNLVLPCSPVQKDH